MNGKNLLRKWQTSETIGDSHYSVFRQGLSQLTVDLKHH